MLTWWVIGVVAAIYAGYAIYFYFFVKKKNVNMLTKQAPGQTLASAQDFHNELNMVADLAVKNMEEKITHLENLIEGAQNKSEQLEHLIENAREKSERLEYLLEDARKKSEQFDVKIKFAGNIVNEIKNLADKQQFSFSAGRPSIEKIEKIEKNFLAKNLESKNYNNGIDILTDFNSDNVDQRSAKSKEDKEKVNNDKHRMVLQMSKEGHSIMDIARITGLGKGEIMLLRQLYNEKQDVREV